MNVNKYKLSVGEPWDFQGVDGKNTILGRVIKEINETTLIFEAYKEQSFEEGKGKFFLLKARYSKEKLVNDNEYGGIVNGFLILEDFSDKSIKEIEKISRYVIIGGLHRC